MPGLHRVRQGDGFRYKDGKGHCLRRGPDEAYVHPAVLALGTTLSADPGAMTDVWDRISGRAKTLRRLHAGEGRLLAFLQEHRRRSVREARADAVDTRAARAEARIQAGVSEKQTVSRSIRSR